MGVPVCNGYSGCYRISDIGPGAKIDIESAQLIPVDHPDDRPLQAMSWNGQIFIDPMLPFGVTPLAKCSFAALFSLLQLPIASVLVQS